MVSNRALIVMLLNPQQPRQGTLEALTSQVEALSRQKPVLMILEDPIPQTWRRSVAR